jgi:cytochrome c553
MHYNFDIIGRMRGAIEQGSIDEASSRATRLKEHLEAMKAPDTWAPHLGRLREVLTVVSSAKDIPTAALGCAEAGKICGQCHSTLGQRVELDPAPQEPSSPLPRENFMMRHAWAAERLWEALIVPSDAAWQQGVRVLSNTPPLDTKFMTEEMQAIADELVPVTKRATTVPADGRAQLYGEILSKCAACHIASTEAG